MALIGLNITISGYVGKLIIVWKKNSNIGAIVGQSAGLDFPVDQIYTIPDLAPVVYLVEFWRSDDGIMFDEFIKSWEVDASKSSLFSEETFTYVVNRGDSGTDPDWADPVANDTQILDERLDGISHDNARVESRGFGRYRPDEINFLGGGGFEFVNPDLKFFADDTFFVTVLNRSDLPTETTATTDYTDIKELKDDSDNSIDFDASFYRKLCYANFSGTIGTIVFPLFALIPDTKVKFQAHEGSQRYLRLQFAFSNTITLNGVARNYIDLAKGESIEIIWKGSVGKVMDYKGWYDEVGEYVPANNKNRLNTHPADGTESDIADYKRVIDNLPAEMIVSYTDYNLTTSVTVGAVSRTYYKNRGKFAVNNGTGKFKWPDARGYSFRNLKYFDATVDASRLTQGAGGIEPHEYINHGHAINSTNSSASGSATADVVRGTTPGTVAGTRGIESGVADDKTIKLSGGSEMRVDNIGQYPLIRI